MREITLDCHGIERFRIRRIDVAAWVRDAAGSRHVVVNTSSAFRGIYVTEAWIGDAVLVTVVIGESAGGFAFMTAQLFDADLEPVVLRLFGSILGELSPDSHVRSSRDRLPKVETLTNGRHRHVV